MQIELKWFATLTASFLSCLICVLSHPFVTASAKPVLHCDRLKNNPHMAVFHKNVKVSLFLTLGSFKRLNAESQVVHSQKQQVLVYLRTLCLLILLVLRNNNICPISSFSVHLDRVTQVSEHQIWVVCGQWSFTEGCFQSQSTTK